jgi:hypothetical protein
MHFFVGNKAFNIKVLWLIISIVYHQDFHAFMVCEIVQELWCDKEIPTNCRVTD